MTALSSPAADRNKFHIADVLKLYLEPGVPCRILEVASGFGAHVMHFSALFPDARWHPTEIDLEGLSSIAAHLALERESGTPRLNVADPVRLDTSKSPRHWPADVTQFAGRYDYVLNINMIHISPWPATLGLFSGAARMLRVGGKLFLYGPFAVDGVLEPQSNVDFDRSLKLNNPEWGVRDLRDLEAVAANENLVLEESHKLPVNNRILVWKKI
jgi:hypothetical protein